MAEEDAYARRKLLQEVKDLEARLRSQLQLAKEQEALETLRVRVDAALTDEERSAVRSLKTGNASLLELQIADVALGKIREALRPGGPEGRRN